VTLNVRDLIKVGFHFGHRTSRWNPKMKPYIFKRRNQIHIVDLRATMRGLITGRELTRAIAARGQYVLFVGTKKQARSLVAEQAERCGMPCVPDRWPGGLLTNFVTIRGRLDRLIELESMESTGQIDLYGKKMISRMRREKARILRNLGGVRKMDKVPGLLVIVDPTREAIAVREAAKLGIPVIALIDTDGNPQQVDVVVPGNDDSIGAIETFLATMADAVLMSRSASPASAQPPTPAPEKAVAAAPADEEQAEAVAEAPVEGEPEKPAEQGAAEAPADEEQVEAVAEAPAEDDLEGPAEQDATEAPADEEQVEAVAEAPVEDDLEGPAEQDAAEAPAEAPAEETPG